MRGKYLTPVQALRVGAKAIRNCFRDQLKAMRQEGLDNIGITYSTAAYFRGYSMFNVGNRDTIRYGW